MPCLGKYRDEMSFTLGNATCTVLVTDASTFDALNDLLLSYARIHQTAPMNAIGHLLLS